MAHLFKNIYIQKYLTSTNKFSLNRSLMRNYQELQNTLSLAIFKCVVEIYTSPMK